MESLKRLQVPVLGAEFKFMNLGFGLNLNSSDQSSHYLYEASLTYLDMKKLVFLKSSNNGRYPVFT